jgi:hypothetical protein
LFSGQDFPQAESKSFCHGLPRISQSQFRFREIRETRGEDLVVAKRCCCVFVVSATEQEAKKMSKIYACETTTLSKVGASACNSV